ncbi:TIGR02680 family protein [Streptomyces sp. NPDC001401]|uniref:TIGR02680 family protein n=1 Tax=Streptomyces sp. NPDC001401 TaxID=3364570 RepID=UPI00367B47CF
MTVTELAGIPGPRRQDTGRWHPSRAGVLNVWRYYDEVFTFHRGRLLLRGPNGTGKSKALEVLLPFLFDASLKPNRLSTFGGSERTMHWNLMGEGASGVTRVGYVWLEFRTDEADGPRWFTIGARLQATSRTTSVGVDFFTVRARVGADDGLSLVGEAGQPLTVAALKEALAGRGEVHDTAADYRAAVRQALFPGLSEQRYDALITALLQLRTPKLSERLDPSLLSTLLSRALPPLDRDEISELADGFERLDRRREELARMDERVEAAGRLAARQRSYAQRVLRARAAELVSATTEMDNHTRAARETEEAFERAVAERATAEQQLTEAQELIGELASRIEVLTDSEEYRQGRELDRLRRQAGQARATAEERRATADAARAEAEEEAERAAGALREADAQQGRTRTAEEETWQAARAAGLTAACTETAAALADGEDNRARQLISGAVRGRLGQIADVRGAVDTHRDAVRSRSAAEEALEVTRAALAEASGRCEETAGAYAAAVEAQAVRLEQWAGGCAELRFDAAAVRELAEQAASEAEVLALTEALARSVERELTTAETMAGQQRRTLAAERAQAAEQAARLEATTDLPPEPPHTRTADRTARPGAPLWKLVAFHDTVPPAQQAAVEAALEASGLLDAWVGPFGGLVAVGHDTFAEAEWSPTAAGGRNLTDVLRPEADAPVQAARIERLLSSIAYGDTLPEGPAAAIGADGTWRLAAATGSWAKPESAHIGALARERARRRRIDELVAQIEELDASIHSCDTESALLADRRRTLDLERHNRPDHTALTTARRALDRAEADAAARDDAVRTAATVLANREREVALARQALDALAAEHGLPADEKALGRLVEHTETLREAAGQWLLASVRLAALRSAAAEAGQRAERAGRGAGQREGEAREAETEAGSLTAAVEEAERTAGAQYQDVLARIEELRTEAGRLERTARQLTQTLIQLATIIGSLDSQRTTAAEQRDTSIAVRDAAAERLRHCLALGLGADAGLDGIELASDAKVTATLEAARAIAVRFSAVAHSPKNIADALERLAETRYATAEILGERADVHLEAQEDLHLLTASVDGALLGAAGILAALTEERDRGRDDITAGERGLFDRILTGDTRRHLATRIRQANELVDTMNARLERVRTASRVAVQLVWQVDPALPPGTRAARDLLLKDPVRLTDADHEALHHFFRERIEEARASQTAGSWEEQLAQVLDYTAWHQFVVRLDRANGLGWQLLTKKLHGALSGGEKAIALHLPLFAAVAAHYHAVPEAPRLILLDEVFVGVDATNRGQVFALLCSLDLDLLLTSDHEWCTYRELDGIAVHQLITDGDDDAVTTARFVWDGAGLLPDEAPA